MARASSFLSVSCLAICTAAAGAGCQAPRCADGGDRLELAFIDPPIVVTATKIEQGVAIVDVMNDGGDEDRITYDVDASAPPRLPPVGAQLVANDEGSCGEVPCLNAWSLAGFFEIGTARTFDDDDASFVPKALHLRLALHPQTVETCDSIGTGEDPGVSPAVLTDDGLVEVASGGAARVTVDGAPFMALGGRVFRRTDFTPPWATCVDADCPPGWHTFTSADVTLYRIEE